MGDDGRSGPQLVLGVVSGDASARASAELLCAELGAAAGASISSRLFPSYVALTDAAASGAAAIVWAPPLVALELEARGAATVVACSRRRSGSTYHAALFTRRELRLSSLAELRGRSIGWVSRQSLSGHIVPRAYLIANGVDPDLVCGAQRFYENHSAVVRAVAGGACDVGATFANLDPSTRAIRDAGWNDVGVRVDAFEVLGVTGAIPADAMALSTRLPERVRAAVTGALIGLPVTARGALRALLHADALERPTAEWRRAFDALRGLPARIHASSRPPA
ncbi:MAG: PhnD/SsuA/transferrin family substrate-binding protein [Polyangiaceae bacterium]|nr:PhnD/SsuA/transferrin family substrate-binding protein [Polyangiaceae bacterium]